MVEVVVDQSLWVWHAIFGLLGENYDISVLDNSPFVNNLFCGKSHDIKFQLNVLEYKRYYLLAYGIYPP
jgi:hypothetical protein